MAHEVGHYMGLFHPVEQTWDWFQAEGLHETREFDFVFEDDVLERLGR